MSVIVSTIEPFIVNQRILTLDDTGNIVATNYATIEDMPKVVSCLCGTTINKVHLYGNRTYCEEMANNIKNEAINTYSNNNLEIEVN